jgi:uncharacterized delta-60 repeat protein
MRNPNLPKRFRGGQLLLVHTSCAVLAAILLLAAVLSTSQAVTAVSDDTSPAAAALDPDFGTGGKVVTDFFGAGNQAHAIAIQGNGKIVVAGRAHTVPGHDDFAVVRYNADGTLDAGFGATGKITTDFFGANDSANAVAIQKDGRVVVAGVAGNTFSSMFGLVRYNPDGGLDTTFGLNGKVTTNFGGFFSANAVAIQSDGRIIVAGGAGLDVASSDFTLARYNADGSLDKSFGAAAGIVTTDFSGSADDATAIAVQQDGKIVVAGMASSPGSMPVNQFALARYNPNGSLDAGFGTGGKVTIGFEGKCDQANAVAIQSDARIVVAGFATTPDGSSSDFALARFTPNGSLDTGFGAGGKVVTDFFGGPDQGNGISIQLDGKIIVAGSAANAEILEFALARYNTDGGLDASFGTGGVTTTPFVNSDVAAALAIQTDNKIVAAGTASDAALGTAGQQFALARYDAGEVVPPPPPQPDFSLSINPTIITAIRGTTTSVTITVVRTAGFAGKVTVSPPGTAPGIVLKPGDPVTTADSAVTFSLKLKGKAPTGEQDLAFTGTDNSGRVRTVTVKLLVQ